VTEWFLNGFDDGLAYALEACDFENFQAMVDKALMLENRRGILTPKCRQDNQTQQSTNPRPHISSSTARPIFCPVTQSSQQMPQSDGQVFDTPQQQMIPCSNPFQTLNTGNQSTHGTPTTQNATPTKANTTCFNCEQKGHYANCCPNQRQSYNPTLGTFTLPNRNGSSTLTQAQQNYA
jgi:hypothetical protein